MSLQEILEFRNVIDKNFDVDIEGIRIEQNQKSWICDCDCQGGGWQCNCEC